ncbi:MAG: class I SAM-dependent methyltransferase [Clostridia bacterium]|nr:class I SAM-dependent methyltransferase [Deltaproteobacteria bacterium]
MSFERYDRIANTYAAMWPLIVPGYQPCLSAMLEVVRAAELRPRDILDLGCGPGSAIATVAPACHPEARVTLVDGSKGMLDAAKAVVGSCVAKAVNDDFRRSDVIGPVTRPLAYDLVLCSFALHHWDDNEKRSVIEALARSVRPGGLILLADEVVADNPGGWDVVGTVRARTIDANITAGRIPQEFVANEAALSADLRLPFKPGRVDETVSWLARSGLAVAVPLVVFGAALHLAIKPV